MAAIRKKMGRFGGASHWNNQFQAEAAARGFSKNPNFENETIYVVHDRSPGEGELYFLTVTPTSEGIVAAYRSGEKTWANPLGLSKDTFTVGLIALGVGALGAYLFWPKSASAAETTAAFSPATSLIPGKQYEMAVLLDPNQVVPTSSALLALLQPTRFQNPVVTYMPGIGQAIPAEFSNIPIDFNHIAVVAFTWGDKLMTTEDIKAMGTDEIAALLVKN